MAPKKQKKQAAVAGKETSGKSKPKKKKTSRGK
jgi:hypothetical protein